MKKSSFATTRPAFLLVWLLSIGAAGCTRTTTTGKQEQLGSTSSGPAGIPGVPGINGVSSTVTSSTSIRAGLNFGVAHWDGALTSSSLPGGQPLFDGLQFLTQTGFHVFKVPVDVSDMNVFGITMDPSNMPSDVNYLSWVAAQPQFINSMELPGVSTVVFSVYDAIVTGLNFASRGFTDPVTLAARATDIQKSYHDFALALLTNPNLVGKKFIFSAWELENALYCGSMYSFYLPNNIDPTTGITFRQACLDGGEWQGTAYPGYLATYGVATPEEAFAAVTQWFQLRQAGIKQAQADALSQGFTGVQILDGLEFVSVTYIHSIINPLTGNPYPTALYDVIPTLKPAAIVYSAYESTNGGTLSQDFPTIVAHAGGAEIGISEFGITEGQTQTLQGSNANPPVAISSDSQLQNTTIPDIVSLEKSGQLSFAIIWEGFSGAGNTPGMALFNGDGTPKPLFSLYVNDIQSQEDPEGAPPVILDFQILGQSAQGGGTGLLSWIVDDPMATVTLQGASVQSSDQAEEALSPGATFTLVATNASGSTQKTVTVASSPAINPGGVAVSTQIGPDGLMYLSIYGASLGTTETAIAQVTCPGSAPITARGFYYFDNGSQLNAGIAPLAGDSQCSVAVNVSGKWSNAEEVVIPGTCLLGVVDLTSNATASVPTGQTSNLTVTAGDSVIWLVTDYAGTTYDSADYQFVWNGTVTKAGVTSSDMIAVLADPASFDGPLPGNSQGTYTRQLTVSDGSGNRVCSTGELGILIQ